MPKRRKVRPRGKPPRKRAPKREPRKGTRGTPKKPKPAKTKGPPVVKRKQSLKGLTQPFPPRAPKKRGRPKKREGGRFHAESRAIAKEIKANQGKYRIWDPRDSKTRRFKAKEQLFATGPALKRRLRNQQSVETALLTGRFPRPLEFDTRRPRSKAPDRPNYRYVYRFEGIEAESLVHELLLFWGVYQQIRRTLGVKSRVVVYIQSESALDPIQSSKWDDPSKTRNWMDAHTGRPSWKAIMKQQQEEDEDIRIVWEVQITTFHKVP